MQRTTSILYVYAHAQTNVIIPLFAEPSLGDDVESDVEVAVRTDAEDDASVVAKTIASMPIGHPEINGAYLDETR